MWQPEPGWHPLPGGNGTSTVGVWRTVLGGRPVVIKRLSAPAAQDPAELSDPRHFAYWRRAADVVTARLALASPGLRAPTLTSVEEDVDGITLVQDWVEDAANSGLFSAHALGRFAAADLGGHSWLARDQLRDRLARVARRGGWPTLARTTAVRRGRTCSTVSRRSGHCRTDTQSPTHGAAAESAASAASTVADAVARSGPPAASRS